MFELAIVEGDPFYDIKPATIQCVVVAASKQKVPANILLAIASIEGGKNGQQVLNKNGTKDISHFQINTATYRKELKPLGVNFDDMRWRGCYNAELSAHLLYKRLNEKSSPNFWIRAANYHSRTPKFNLIYRKKLIKLSAEWADWLSNNYSAVNIIYK